MSVARIQREILLRQLEGFGVVCGTWTYVATFSALYRLLSNLTDEIHLKSVEIVYREYLSSSLLLT